MHIRFLLFSLVSIFAFAAAGHTSYSIAPDRGPVAGGTQVTITGDFGAWPYGVIFGKVHVPATRIDEHTLVATTPAHLPGTVPVGIFEYDIGLATDVTFTFQGTPEDAFDRLLLPVFTPPIRGAFGSEFRTELQMALARSATQAEIHGLGNAPIRLDANLRTLPEVERTGKPGRFIYVPKGTAKDLVMYLRAYDVSRASDNFGTQIPIVPRSEFATDHYSSQVGIIGIPSDPRFRNTLRIYGAGEFGGTLFVDIEAAGLTTTHRVDLDPTGSIFEPSYAELSNFPVGVGPIRVWIRIHAPPISALLPAPELWAFVSVTNNETQHITTITPR